MYFVESQIFLINILRILTFFRSDFGNDLILFGFFFYYWIMGNILIIVNIFSLMLKAFGFLFNGSLEIFRLSNNLESLLIHFSIISMAIFSLFSQKKMMIFIEKIKNFESNISILSTAPELISSKIFLIRKKSIYSMIGMTFLMITFTISHGAETTEFNLEKFVRSFFLYLSYGLIDYYICAIAIYLICIIESLSIYLDVIGEYVETRHRDSIFSSHKNMIEIRHLIDEFSETFGVLIFYDYIFGFATFTFELFNNFQFISKIGSNKIKSYRIPMVLINSMIWMAPLVIIMCIMSRGCSNFESKFHRIIQRLQMNVKHDRATDKIIQNQSLEDILTIQAAGFFYVDKSMIFKVSNSDFSFFSKFFNIYIITSSVSSW